MMDNIYIRTGPARNIKSDKEKSTERIAGAIATIMAFDVRYGSATNLTKVYMSSVDFFFNIKGVDSYVTS